VLYFEVFPRTPVFLFFPKKRAPKISLKRCLGIVWGLGYPREAGRGRWVYLCHGRKKEEGMTSRGAFTGSSCASSTSLPTDGVRKVGAASNGESIRQPNGGPMLPEELRPAPGEGAWDQHAAAQRRLKPVEGGAAILLLHQPGCLIYSLQMKFRECTRRLARSGRVTRLLRSKPFASIRLISTSIRSLSRRTVR
jgi:hypothetical protein